MFSMNWELRKKLNHHVNENEPLSVQILHIWMAKVGDASLQLNLKFLKK